jgi:hypothetical protein
MAAREAEPTNPHPWGCSLTESRIQGGLAHKRQNMHLEDAWILTPSAWKRAPSFQFYSINILRSPKRKRGTLNTFRVTPSTTQ